MNEARMTGGTFDPPGARNRTRTSRSIPRRLLSEGKLHLIPLYALARTSDLAREGMDNSGSFRFADHVYRAAPSGRYGIGRFLDALLLSFPASRSMRERYVHARRQIVAALGRAPQETGVRVLSIPCGIAREMVEAVDEVRRDAPETLSRARFFGVDLDDEPLTLSRALATDNAQFEFIRGDALDPASFPSSVDLIVSTGFGEFLDDRELDHFYRLCRGALCPGGRFVTSGLRRAPLVDWMLRELAELHVRYRAPDDLELALREAGFTEVLIEPDRVGLQWLVNARRPPETR